MYNDVMIVLNCIMYHVYYLTAYILIFVLLFQGFILNVIFNITLPSNKHIDRDPSWLFVPTEPCYIDIIHLNFQNRPQIVSTS